ncbi:MAG: type II toxin-antitoxin system Phd/YefM family antitoxin [Acidobacteria bacterium]|nr:type II toxin-antitoxin system Phd/YefM family antitoxin [Acidobacteriota bacterium]
MDMWRIAEAKQQFSEVVRRSGDAPQKIYRRDRLVAVVVSPDVLATIEAVRGRQSPRTLADAFSDVRSACLEERYELELPERRDREAWEGDDS